MLMVLDHRQLSYWTTLNTIKLSKGHYKNCKARFVLYKVDRFDNTIVTIPVPDEGVEPLDLAGGGQCPEGGWQWLASCVVCQLLPQTYTSGDGRGFMM